MPWLRPAGRSEAGRKSQVELFQFGEQLNDVDEITRADRMRCANAHFRVHRPVALHRGLEIMQITLVHTIPRPRARANAAPTARVDQSEEALIVPRYYCRRREERKKERKRERGLLIKNRYILVCETMFLHYYSRMMHRVAVVLKITRLLSLEQNREIVRV